MRKNSEKESCASPLHESEGELSEAKPTGYRRRYPCVNDRGIAKRVNFTRVEEGQAIAVRKFFAYFLSRAFLEEDKARLLRGDVYWMKVQEGQAIAVRKFFAYFLSRAFLEEDKARLLRGDVFWMKVQEGHAIAVRKFFAYFLSRK